MRSEKSQRKWYFALTAVYMLFVLYITLFSRNALLTPKVRATPFWSYASWLEGNRGQARSLILNIGLFVPIGYFIANCLATRLHSKKCFIVSILLCLVISGIIEAVQYFTHLGSCDCDDLINNTIGGTIGILSFIVLGDNRLKIILPIVFLIAGSVGCLIASGFKNVTDDTYLRQFDFDIYSVTCDSDRMIIHGYCVAYNRETPGYRISLRSIKCGIENRADTDIDKDEFTASVMVDPNDKYEIVVQFDGYKPMSTATYIERMVVEYMVNEAPDPEVNGTDIENIIRNGILKAYNADNEVYVYQVEDKLYWLIGTDFEDDTTALYHLQTNELEKLPEGRKIYGFDNMDFRSNSGKELTENMDCGKYRVFETEIPNESLVTAISVGFSRNKTIEWIEYFRPSRWQ